MVRAATIVVVTALLIKAIPTSAQTADAEYNRCINNPDAATNAVWRNCSVAFLEREEDKLTATWKRTYASTSGQTKIDLLAEQRAWIAFKEKSCQFYANGDWGREGTVLSFYICRGGVIAERRRALEEYGLNQ